MLGQETIEIQQDFYRRICKLARQFPKTKFLLFTKLHHINFSGRPKNLAVILSMWKGYGDTKKKMPRCWVRDYKNLDSRIPSDAVECSGNCESCGMCWSLSDIGKDVVINKH